MTNGKRRSPKIIKSIEDYNLSILFTATVITLCGWYLAFTPCSVMIAQCHCAVKPATLPGCAWPVRLFFFSISLPFLIGAGIVVSRRIDIWRVTQANPCRHLNLTYQQVEQAVAQHDIQPRYIIGGVKFFHAADFANINTLLRASVQPTASQETLLRSAIGTEEAQSEQLLRAAQE